VSVNVVRRRDASLDIWRQTSEMTGKTLKRNGGDDGARIRAALFLPMLTYCKLLILDGKL
jgi:hypothetical protein